MIGSRPVLTFDTSVYNRMLRDGANSDVILTAIRVGYVARIAGVSVEEICATESASTRQKLMTYVKRLQTGPSDYLLSHNDLLSLLIAAYESSPSQFDWRSVDISSDRCLVEIACRAFVEDDTLAEAQRLGNIKLRKQFENAWSSLRLTLEKVIQRHGETAPRTFNEILPMAEADGGLLWSSGHRLYRQVAKGDASEGTVRDFMTKCPPFRAVAYAYLLALFDRAFGDRHQREKYKAGRIDLFMAIYLPYCDQFISAEEKGMQEECLRAIAGAAGLSTQVRSYDDFRNSLLWPLSHQPKPGR